MYLSAIQYCDKCNKFLKESQKSSRYYSDPDKLVAMVKHMGSYFNNKNFKEAINDHDNSGEIKNTKDGFLNSVLMHKECPVCNKSWLKLSVHKFSSNNWVEMEEFSLSKYKN